MTDKKDLPKFTQAELAVLSEKSKKFNGEASPEQCIADLRKLQNRNPLSFITRNFYRINGKYSDATWNRHFGTFLEFRRQAKLELSRQQHKLERDIAKHASADVYRKFYREEILPYHQKHNWTEKQKGRYKTIIVGSDFHDTEVDRFCLSVFIDTIKRIQPDVICFNGDFSDFFEFSSFAADPRRCDVKGKLDFIKKEIFEKVRKAAPKAQIDAICANHEYRLIKHLATNSPAIRILMSDVLGLSFKDIFGLDEFGINLVAKFDLSAFSVEDIGNELKQNYQVYWDCFVAHHYKDLGFGLSGTSGHVHHPSQEFFYNHPMGNLIWTTTGCMAKTDAEYLHGLSKWQNSFLIAHVDREKKQVVQNHITMTGDFVVVDGKIYERE